MSSSALFPPVLRLTWALVDCYYLGNGFGHIIWSLDQLKAIVKVKPSKAATEESCLWHESFLPLHKAAVTEQACLWAGLVLLAMQVGCNPREQVLLGEEGQTTSQRQPWWLSREAWWSLVQLPGLSPWMAVEIVTNLKRTRLLLGTWQMCGNVWRDS